VYTIYQPPDGSPQVSVTQAGTAMTASGMELRSTMPVTPRKLVCSMSAQPQQVGAATQAQCLTSSNISRFTSSPMDQALCQMEPKQPSGKDIGVHVNLDRLQSLLQEFKGQQGGQKPSAVTKATPEGPSIITAPTSTPHQLTRPPSYVSAAASPVPQTMAAAAAAPMQSAHASLEAWMQEQKARTSSRGPTTVANATSNNVLAATGGSPWMRSASAQRSAIRESSRHSLGGQTPAIATALTPQRGSPMQPQTSHPFTASPSPVRPLPTASLPGGMPAAAHMGLPLLTSPIAAPGLMAMSSPIGQTGLNGMQFRGLGQELPMSIPKLPFSADIPVSLEPLTTPAAAEAFVFTAELPPPPRCAPANSTMNFQGPEATGAARMDLPPPPRCSPVSTQRLGSVDNHEEPLTQRLGYAEAGRAELDAGLTRTAIRPLGPCAEALPGTSNPYVLKVQMAEDRQDSFVFSAAQSLEKQAAIFLQKHTLKPAFQSGLIERMQHMVSAGQQRCSADIVDLI